jgi:pentatricopeptide repeat domain-containing protein 2
MDLWKELKEVGHFPMRRAITFAAGLALNQNAPHVAFEIISGMNQQNYVTVRNLKVHVLMTSMHLTSLISINLKCIYGLTTWLKSISNVEVKI